MSGYENGAANNEAARDKIIHKREVEIAALKKEIEEAPILFGCPNERKLKLDSGSEYMVRTEWSYDQAKDDTHTCRAIRISKI
jgi:hypothetical protein